MTPIEQRLLAGEQVTFHEALYDACMHGELTADQAREWLDGEDLEIALRVIKSGLFLERHPARPARRIGGSDESGIPR